MTKLEQVEVYKYQPMKAGYAGPTWYMGKEVPPWSHPATIANNMLDVLYHKRFRGLMIIGTMGDGKTKLAQTLAHQIHMKASEGFEVIVEDIETGKELKQTVKWNFRVVWAGEHEFTHQDEFYKSLPKVPHIIIYDDISGALKQIGEKQLEANFSTLTQIRWKLDSSGEIPSVVIVNYHYSKNLEKEFRSVLGMTTIFTEISSEERTNIDTLAPRGSQAHYMLKNFDKVSKPMFTEHKFNLYLPNGKKLDYITDHPFRCACAITKDDGKIILFAKHDTCDICIKKKSHRIVSAKVVWDELVALGYGTYGTTALKVALERRGYQAAHPYFKYATNFLETKIFPRYDFDCEEMAQYARKQEHKKGLEKKNPKRRQEKEALKNIEQVSEVKYQEIAENSTDLEQPKQITDSNTVQS
jgi:hypothetical protein